LNDALQVLCQNQIDLTRIESKPSKFYTVEKAHDFYVDFKGTTDDNNVRTAISDLSKIS